MHNNCKKKKEKIKRGENRKKNGEEKKKNLHYLQPQWHMLLETPAFLSVDAAVLFFDTECIHISVLVQTSSILLK